MKHSRPAAILLLLFFLLALASIFAIVRIYHPPMNTEGRIADVYQDGVLTHSFPLDQMEEPFQLTLTSADGGTNLLEVRPGSIGILSADCPDLLCVKQGFLSDSLLPITCLPHRLVISIRP